MNVEASNAYERGKKEGYEEGRKNVLTNLDLAKVQVAQDSLTEEEKMEIGSVMRGMRKGV